MTSFKKFVLVFALGLLGAACGDDNNGTPSTDAGGDKPDAGGEDAGDTTGGGGGEDCIGGYKGYTEGDIKANIKGDDAKCASEVDVAGVCAKDPPEKTKELGLACFLAFNGDNSLSAEEKKAKIGDCTLNGTSSSPGLTTELKPISKACLSCYVDSVLCAVQNCTAECGSDPGSNDCSQCRLDNKCTSTFHECSGLPTGDDLEAAK